MRVQTTVAKLYGEVLTDLGLLSKGECIIKNPSDFIGSVLGSSEQNTRAILSQAEGCVLVIDEAYLLNASHGGGTSGSRDPYKDAVIDTIVETVQGVPGEDRAVVILGYKKEMEALMAAANPGLSRRFQMENALVFKDYSDTSLVRILMKRCVDEHIKLSLPVAIFAVKQLSKAREQPNFGNAGALNNLLSEAKKAMSSRLSTMPKHERKDELIESDFGVMEKDSSPETLFQGLVGCENIINKLREYHSIISLCKAKGQDPKKFIEYNFMFLGAPGTGSSTLSCARRCNWLIP
jgi:hypothetical protein